jgi:hypothetical protein
MFAVGNSSAQCSSVSASLDAAFVQSLSKGTLPPGVTGSMRQPNFEA